MRMMNAKLVIVPIIILGIFSSCATFKSSIDGKLDTPPLKNFNAERASVLFIFSHYQQTLGSDAIPKLSSSNQRVHDFDDFFLDALDELSNIEKYATFTNYPSDVSNTKRRAEKDSLLKQHDFTINMKFKREKSFAKFFFGTIVSSVSATVIPIKYKYKYSVEVNVYDKNQKLVHVCKREAHLSKWVQTLMVFMYPFFHQQRVEEELYVEFLHDIFKDIETNKILIN